MLLRGTLSNLEGELDWGRRFGLSDHLLYVPDEGADADFFVALVELADGGEDVFDFFVGDNGHNGVVEFGPGVGATMRLAVLVSASLDVFPVGEAAHIERVEHILDALVVGLIINN